MLAILFYQQIQMIYSMVNESFVFNFALYLLFLLRFSFSCSFSFSLIQMSKFSPSLCVYKSIQVLHTYRTHFNITQRNATQCKSNTRNENLFGIWIVCLVVFFFIPLLVAPYFLVVASAVYLPYIFFSFCFFFISDVLLVLFACLLLFLRLILACIIFMMKM